MTIATDTQPLLRELIDIPEQVSAGDLVTELVSAVTEAQRTVDEYVVTRQLAESFDKALGLVALSAGDGRSRATFLHGSFGAGKSHFMAVLHLLLQGDPHARAKAGLQEVVHNHDPQLSGKRWLLVPYHMLGASSLEQGVLGGYAAHVRALHADAPEPAIFRDQKLFENARELRQRLGDAAFFDALGGEGGGGFGRFGGAAWTAERFSAAIEAPPTSKERSALQSALLSGLLSAMRGAASGDATQYVGIDDGLAIITQHAKDLGYDGLILFLDELILWLASRLSDEAFVAEEASKVPKLRESGNASRVLPIVSFVARQRDLREFVGRDSPGAQQAAFADTLDYGEGRFDTIQLEDENLPEIARHRVLWPKSPEAAATIDAAFREVAAQTSQQRSVLLTSTGTVEQFRATYPFSPALMQVLVALSSALQRNRTALKVLKTLLMRRREELRLGDLVGVGEIWDVVLESPEPFSAALANQAQQARRLYREKLRPMLLEEAGLDDDTAQDLPWSHIFRANDRLIKTLLIAALVPSAEPVRDLTVSRLAALNHGSVRSRIPGNETAQLLGRLHTWSSKVGEVKVGEDPNDPTVGIALSGVDVQSVLDGARQADTPGSRRQKVREHVFAMLELDDTRLNNQLTMAYSWRGTTRVADVRFGNVRDEQDITAGALRPSGDGWCLVIDFPFDVEGFRPSDDLARLEQWRTANPDGARTIVWLPAFLSGALQADLGRLVIHDHVLAGDGFRRYAAHLSDAEQASARRTLETQRDALRARLRIALIQAYGLQTPSAEFVDVSMLPDEGEAGIVRSLTDFEPRRPVGAGLRDAAERLLGQGLEHELPGHPHFGREPKPRDLARVLELVRDAMQQEAGRLVVQDRAARELLRALAVPMAFGDMGETAFALKDRWPTWLEQKLAGDPRPNVGQLRTWLEGTDLQGIPTAAQDLAVIAVVEHAGRRFTDHGVPVPPPAIGRLSEGLEIVDQPMPSREEWAAAVERVSSLLGHVPIAAYASQAVSTLAAEVRQRMEAKSGPLLRLETALRGRGAPADGDRVQTAEALAEFSAAVVSAGDDLDLLRAFGTRPLDVTATVAIVALAHPDVQETLLADADWTTVDQLRTLAARGDAEAAELLVPLDQALRFDEHAAPLEPRLRTCARAGKALIDRRLRKQPSPDPDPDPDPSPGVEVVIGAQAAREVIDRLTAEAGAELEFTIRWRASPS